ncbi:MAG: Mitochondrial matrix cochaperone [Piccolia ochrophora]|nr:MAG: Mitochondrial matrix cochaperone [Piccolia ochrophora]
MIRRALLRQTRLAGFRHSSRTLRLQPSPASTPHPFPRPPQRLAVSRCYSTSAESQESTTGEATAGDSASNDAKAPEDPTKKELDAKSKEIIELKDKYLRSVADFRNLQDRTKRDISNSQAFAIQRFAKDLIDSIDNLDRALTTVPPEKLSSDASPDGAEAKKDLFALYDGLKMTENILMQTLKKHGLERFDPSEGDGQRFDPNLHEATFQTPVEGKEDGTVFHTQQKGFSLNGRVLRAAKVGVVKNA